VPFTYLIRTSIPFVVYRRNLVSLVFRPSPSNVSLLICRYSAVSGRAAFLDRRPPPCQQACSAARETPTRLSTLASLLHTPPLIWTYADSDQNVRVCRQYAFCRLRHARGCCPPTLAARPFWFGVRGSVGRPPSLHPPFSPSDLTKVLISCLTFPLDRLTEHKPKT